MCIRDSFQFARELAHVDAVVRREVKGSDQHAVPPWVKVCGRKRRENFEMLLRLDVGLGKFRAGQIAPTRDAIDTHCDHGLLHQIHRGELRIARAKQPLCIGVLIARCQDLRVTMQHHPAEAGPVLIVVVDYQCHRAVRTDIAHAFERMALDAFRFTVDADVQGVARKYKAYRNDMRDSVLIGGREVRDSSMRHEAAFAIRQHA